MDKRTACIYIFAMDALIGTPQCPHLGFAARDGLPCCHADEATRAACGRYAPNPAARGKRGSEIGMLGLEAWFCTVLGKDALPAEALRLAELEKAAARKAGRQPARAEGYRPPNDVTGRIEARPEREQDAKDGQPVIPTHTLRAEGRKTRPNEPCPCGSGKKFKKCCGRGG
ncbi:MAG: SEC-C metal-binding domain-containing protein [Planctomycetota bacterium]|nr:SEC-C metal-binding domain-containing protein [Planctomycetota bacterium]